MAVSNPMFQPVDNRATQLAASVPSKHDFIRKEVCRLCGDAAVRGLQRAVADAEQEAKTLQIQLLDLESDVLFDINGLQEELLDVRNTAADLLRQLQTSEEKRQQEHAQKVELEQQVLQMSEEILRLKLVQCSSPQPFASFSEGSSQHSSIGRMPSVEQPGTPEQAFQAAERLSDSGEETDGSDEDETAPEKPYQVLEAELLLMHQELRNMTQELVQTKMELSLSHQDMGPAYNLQIEQTFGDVSAYQPSSVSLRRLWPVKRGPLLETVPEASVRC